MTFSPSPSPLPSTATTNFDAEGTRIWHLLLAAEKEALDISPGLPAKYNDNLIGIRVLGFFLKDFWDHQDCYPFRLTPYRHLVFVLNCTTEDDPENSEPFQARMKKVFELGIEYRNHLMSIYRPNESSELRSTPPTRDSPRSWDEVRADIIASMAHLPTTKRDAKKQALCRDGYKCLISGSYDYFYLKQLPADRGAEIIAAEENFRAGPTDIVHLFPESTQGVKSSSSEDYFAISKLFGIRDYIKLTGGEVNDLLNVLTISVGLRPLFDDFTFWLESVPQQPNTYNVVSTHPDLFAKLSMSTLKRVTFQVDPTLVREWNTNSPKDTNGNIPPLPSLPDPSLIAMRAACARVARLSGAVEQAEQILEDRENASVMDNKGGTADLLNSLLLRYGAQATADI
ncbi:hypothetical protein BDN70DRAFT_894535 [Pholiota conissans]|uniref:HNH nuclease domain-containing protein n=1 Tax=Pholiota conissans TaxID=109636 RepID=A0A9P6D1R0_9AGAR|nr:hypothetical protein BDN70DRAFT_894535 [Pholiota conissans]